MDINRNLYLGKMLKGLNTDFVKILSGVRRCGKSSMLQVLKNHLLATGTTPEQIIDINFEKDEWDYLKVGNAFTFYIKEHIQKGKRCYLLIDEVQEIEEWARKINSLRASLDCDIFVSGSNSRLFSGEHLTYLSGRYIEIKMLPLSFSEYIDFKLYNREKVLDAPDAFLNEYINKGSFPAPALVDDPYLQDTIMSGLFDSIFMRDIILRGKIRNVGTFLKVAKFLFENIGSPVSANSIANTLKSQGHSISVDAVENYLNLMCNAFVLYQCERYNIRGKERLRTNGKYYCVDTSLRSYLIGNRNSDFGHILENLVYLELIRRGYDVDTGIAGANGNSTELDFVATKAGRETAYFQVCQTVMDSAVLERELKPFRMVQDNYPKYLLTMDRIDFSRDGIKHLNIADWLLRPGQ